MKGQHIALVAVLCNLLYIQHVAPLHLVSNFRTTKTKFVTLPSKSLYMTSSVEPNDFQQKEYVQPSTIPPYTLSSQQSVYVVLTSVFVTCLLIADVIGVKLFEITLPFEIMGHKTVEHTCGMLTFPITFILGDTINEYYGSKAAKNTVYIGLAMSIFVFLIMNIAQAMPYLDRPYNVTPESFDMIFGSAKLLYVASVMAYLFGSLSDIWLFEVIKKATNGEYLWLRATGSTVISQMLDSFVVSYVAFSFGKVITGQPAASIPEVLNIAATGYGLKLFLSFAMTPLLYALKAILKDNFGLSPIPVSALTLEEQKVKDKVY